MARYFGTVTLINAGLGIATGIAMYWLGMPNPVLWGAMAFAFNYFPYLGAAASLAVLTVVAALTFDELRQVLAVPAVFFTFTVIEGQFLVAADHRPEPDPEPGGDPAQHAVLGLAVGRRRGAARGSHPRRDQDLLRARRAAEAAGRVARRQAVAGAGRGESRRKRKNSF